MASKTSIRRPGVASALPQLFLARWHNFHRADGGQISMLAVFGAVALVGLLGMVMTTGDQVSQKIQMQNAVDAAALSGGAWIARGLNTTSAFNLIQTQLAGGAILLQGLQKALPLIQVLVGFQFARYTACASVWPPCVFPATVTYAQLIALNALRAFVDPLAELLARCPGGLFWLVAKGLEWINAFVHHTFVFIALAEANDVARANGAGYALFLPGPLFHGSMKLTMPTAKKTFQEHCDPMVSGSRQRLQRGYHPLIGYPLWKGPFTLGRDRLRRWVRWLGGLPSWYSVLLYDSIMEMQKNAICYGGRCGSWRPNAYLLNPAADGLSFLAIAHRANRKSFFTGPRVATPPDFYTYAQVEIYNGVNGATPDAYTQDWRVRLAPASLLAYPWRASALIAGSPLAQFASFAQSFLDVDEVKVSGALWQVGNH